MTEKLYYLDAYIKEFSASVIACEKTEDGFDTVLDKTAFFPEEAGQYSDTGYIEDAEVKYVYERDSLIHHITSAPFDIGASVHCKLNFEERYEKMQCHTGEHLLSGLFHSYYGCTNVGFHLSSDELTMDLDKELSEDEIIYIEELANRIIYENVPVTAYFPEENELREMSYRSKLELTENVRIVKIGEYDLCACCAPHVARTGEIGVIKILETMRHRGGVRLFVTAGIRAYRDYSARCEAVRRVSALTSTPRLEIADGVKKLLSDIEVLKLQNKTIKEELFLKYSADVPATDGNTVLYFPTADMDDLCVVANSVISRIGGILVLLFGEEKSFKYLMVSNSCDLKTRASEINRALLGRGGGKPNAIQGTFGASLAEIKAYFENKSG